MYHLSIVFATRRSSLLTYKFNLRPHSDTTTFVFLASIRRFVDLDSFYFGVLTSLSESVSEFSELLEVSSLFFPPSVFAVSSTTLFIRFASVKSRTLH